MKIERCFEILEIDPSASLYEARQAYKDIASVWHPDRFVHNPRLMKKAEHKIKEINAAYAQIESLLSLPNETRPSQAEKASEVLTRDRTEAVAEAGTQFVLTVCSFLYKRLRNWAKDQASDSGMTGITGRQGSPSARKKR